MSIIMFKQLPIKDRPKECTVLLAEGQVARLGTVTIFHSL